MVEMSEADLHELYNNLHNALQMIEDSYDTAPARARAEGFAVGLLVGTTFPNLDEQYPTNEHVEEWARQQGDYKLIRKQYGVETVEDAVEWIRERDGTADVTVLHPDEVWTLSDVAVPGWEVSFDVENGGHFLAKK